MISVGSIDCAQDVNVPTCREYEVRHLFCALSPLFVSLLTVFMTQIMGYPSLRYFSPNTLAGDTGQGAIFFYFIFIRNAYLAEAASKGRLRLLLLSYSKNLELSSFKIKEHNLSFFTFLRPKVYFSMSLIWKY